MNVSKQEFDAYKLEASSSHERLHNDVKSSYDSIMTFMINFQSHFEERFNTLEAKFDDRFNALEAKFDSRFNALELKFDRRFSAIDHRFDVLETKTDRIEK
jgi:hypothetical protein